MREPSEGTRTAPDSTRIPPVRTHPCAPAYTAHPAYAPVPKAAGSKEEQPQWTPS